MGIEPDLRTEEDIYKIESLVQDNSFLSQFKGTQKMKDLCKEMTLEIFEEGLAIIREGEVGDKFYIIHSGKVAVFKNMKVTEDSNKEEIIVLRKLIELSKGNSFGELALMHEAPR